MAIDIKQIKKTLMEAQALKKLNELEASRIVKEQFEPAIKRAVNVLKEDEMIDKEEAEEEPAAPVEEVPVDDVASVEEPDENIDVVDDGMEDEEPEVLMDADELEKVVDEMVNSEYDEPMAEMEDPVVDPVEEESVDMVEQELEDVMKDEPSEPATVEIPTEEKEEVLPESTEPKGDVADVKESVKLKKSNADLLSENKKLKKLANKLSNSLSEALVDQLKNKYLSELWKQGLTKEQKYMIAERFDEAETIEQVQMLFKTLKEAVNLRNKVSRSNKPRIKSTASLKESLTEKAPEKKDSELVSYFTKLTEEIHY